MKPNYSHKIVKILSELKKDFPQCNLGKHLATALDDHDLWSMTDKEMYNCLEEYSAELSIDVPHKEDEEINKIINDGMNLTSVLYEDDDEE